MIFDIFANFPLGEGFGINGNLLETNVVNLAVVIGVLVKYGGEIATQTLNDRKEKIVKSISDADERYAEAQRKLEKAKQRVELAEKKADKIRKQGFLTADQTAKAIRERAEQDIKRLEISKQTTFEITERKLTVYLYKETVRNIMRKAREILIEIVWSSSSLEYRSEIVDFYAARLGVKKIKAR